MGRLWRQCRPGLARDRIDRARGLSQAGSRRGSRPPACSAAGPTRTARSSAAPFPHWATIPSSYSLAAGRRWHLAFAWILAIGLIAFVVTSLLNRHAQRDLAPRLAELKPRSLWHDIRDHARLRFPTGEAALRYNILQKLSYFGVIFILLPLVILTGLTMSPGMNAAWPWLLDVFGGRQSARSIHFICAVLLAAFILVHLVMVVLAGPINEVRSMITGWYRVPREKEPA